MSASAPRPELMWNPTTQQREDTRLWDFMGWVEHNKGVRTRTYREIWQWSTADISGFWGAVWEYFDVLGYRPDNTVLESEDMPGAQWFPSASVNFAENLLRRARDPRTANELAIIDIDERDHQETLTWAQIEARTSALAAHLREVGVRQGDAVVAALPNVPEAIIGLLAAASVGAIWSVASPDLSVAAMLERFSQLEPVVLIGTEGYEYNGKFIDRREYLRELSGGLPTLEAVVAARPAGQEPGASAPDVGDLPVRELVEICAAAHEHAGPPEYAELGFGHPLWVLFSSGTTGAPKGIVHSHGGILLESLKLFGLNQSLVVGDRYYVSANTSWMMWNTLPMSMVVGASIVTTAGSPTYPRADRQLDILSRTSASLFATGAAYLALVEKSGLAEETTWELPHLRAIFSTGSPLADSTWQWFHEKVKRDVHLGSDSGGTDVCSALIGSNPLEPVHLGELQGPLLGVAADSYGAGGTPVAGEVGELVVTKPLPSMPIYLWNDDDGGKYRSAYFDTFPGVWAQGDWVSVTDSGGFVVHGRSDATLNRAGVRLGTAEIYAAVQGLAGVRDSLVIGVELPGGGYYMPMFLALEAGVELDDALEGEIAGRIRARASARHVPDEIIVVPDIPLTHAGKKIEIPIKNLYRGVPADEAVNRASVANPGALDWFIRAAGEFQER